MRGTCQSAPHAAAAVLRICFGIMYVRACMLRTQQRDGLRQLLLPCRPTVVLRRHELLHSRAAAAR